MLERDNTLNNLLSVLYRFPDSPDANSEFVRAALNLVTAPILVVDQTLTISFANLQGEEVLLRSGSGVGQLLGGLLEPEGRDVLSEAVRACFREQRPRVLRSIETGGTKGGAYEALLCPGRVQASDMCFLILLPMFGRRGFSLDRAAEVLLDSIDAAVAVMDTATRVRRCNRRLLDTYGLNPADIEGKTYTERMTSEQAKVATRQTKHMMESGTVIQSKCVPIPTSKKGLTVGSVIAWPLCSKDGKTLGAIAHIRPIQTDSPRSAMNGDVGINVFGETALAMGPPLFFTDLDGNIMITNRSGEDLMSDGTPAGRPNLKTAIPWEHPEIICRIYEDMAGGLDSVSLMTSATIADASKMFRVTAYGLRDVGDFTSSLLFHLVEVTEAEQMRKLLTDTVRNLATEKAILSKVIENTPMAYAVVDRDLNILRVSDSVAKRYGLPLEAFVGKKVHEVDPTAGEKGIIGCIKTAIDRRQEVRIPKLAYTIRTTGQEAVIALSFSPIEIGGRLACLIGVESLTDREELRADTTRKSGLHRAVLDGVSEGVAILDVKGNILDVNPVLQRMMGKDKQDIIGKHEDELLAVEERDLLHDFRIRTIMSRKPLNTGDLKLTGTIDGKSIFVNITYVPTLAPDGGVDRVTAIIRFLTEVMDLERRIEEYTKNLEKLVGDRTEELTSANRLLEGTVEKLASMAQSGTILSSLKDTESVMASFLKEAGQVLGADFVSVALIEASNGTYKTTYYSRGNAPPPDEVPSGIVEAGLARLTAGEMSDEVAQPKVNILTASFNLTDHRGLLLAWRRDGEFTEIDRNLSRLLCTQLGFSLPITRYVTDLRRERDRSQALRRIGFQVAGTSSVLGAMKIVAAELSRILSADRFFWLVSKGEEDLWVTEVYRTSGVPVRGSKHLKSDLSGCLRPVFKACQDSHRLFCERLPHLVGGGAAGDWPVHGAELCPFAEEGERAKLVKCIKRLLEDAGLLGKDRGSLVVAPVTLSSKSWGMLCAYKGGGGESSGEEACFICLAAATIGHMWEAADAASNVRRLTIAGETVSELAHDLKYPLMRLRDSIASISCCPKDDIGKDPGISGISEEVERLALLANELIEMSNAGSRKYELVDIGEMVDQCLSLTAADTESKSVRIEKHIDSGVPPVFANKKDVKLVLLNVLANCIDAAGTGGSVRVAATKGESPTGVECVMLTISDSGPGVPADQIGRIFDPFYTRREGGSGLGLFSAKKRARANGGDVVCDIGRDGMSRFVVQFPRASG